MKEQNKITVVEFAKNLDPNAVIIDANATYKEISDIINTVLASVKNDTTTVVVQQKISKIQKRIEKRKLAAEKHLIKQQKKNIFF